MLVFYVLSSSVPAISASFPLCCIITVWYINFIIYLSVLTLLITGCFPVYNNCINEMYCTNWKYGKCSIININSHTRPIEHACIAVCSVQEHNNKYSGAFIAVSCFLFFILFLIVMSKFKTYSKCLQLRNDTCPSNDKLQTVN